MTPLDPVTLGLCSQIDLDLEVQRRPRKNRFRSRSRAQRYCPPHHHHAEKEPEEPTTGRGEEGRRTDVECGIGQAQAAWRQGGVSVITGLLLPADRNAGVPYYGFSDRSRQPCGFRNVGLKCRHPDRSLTTQAPQRRSACSEIFRIAPVIVGDADVVARARCPADAAAPTTIGSRSPISFSVFFSDHSIDRPGPTLRPVHRRLHAPARHVSRDTLRLRLRRQDQIGEPRARHALWD